MLLLSPEVRQKSRRLNMESTGEVRREQRVRAVIVLQAGALQEGVRPEVALLGKDVQLNKEFRHVQGLRQGLLRNRQCGRILALTFLHGLLEHQKHRSVVNASARSRVPYRPELRQGHKRRSLMPGRILAVRELPELVAQPRDGPVPDVRTVDARQPREKNLCAPVGLLADQAREVAVKLRGPMPRKRADDQGARWTCSAHTRA
mmetsp:Transcript_29519/g.80757  ORF Transcript_29519/g.80757 Transcript_29519/m.80757 type:complete len:204 (-) Transcript_29519:263-874(-)